VSERERIDDHVGADVDGVVEGSAAETVAGSNPSRVARLGAWVRTPSAWEAIAIVVFTTWIAWPFLAPGGYVTDYDTAAYSGPNLEATYRAWSEGRLPWWEPGVFGGTAFSANLQTAIFYPLKLVFWPLGAPAAMGAMTVTHLFMLAFGMRHLVRRTLHLAVPAGLVAVVVMVGAGSTMVRSVRFEQIAVIGWVPWLLVALDAVMVARPGRRARSVGACALVGALMVLSGHPQQIYLGGALAGVWVVGRLLDHRPRIAPIDPDATDSIDPDPTDRDAVDPDAADPDRADAGSTLRRIGRLALAGGLALGIAALPLVTSLPLFGGDALPPEVLIEQATFGSYVLDPLQFVPTFFGDPWSMPAALSYPTAEGPSFLGVAAIAMAVVGAAVALGRSRRSANPMRATAATLIVAAVGCVLLAFGPGGGVYRVAADIVPGLGQGRVPLRWLFLTTFAVAVLAAVGASALAQSRVSRRRPTVVGLAVVAAATLAPPYADAGPPVLARLTWMIAVAAVAAAVIVVVRRPDRSRINVLAVVAVAVVVIELGAPARHSYGRILRGDEPFTEQSANPTTAFLAQQGERYLVVGGSDANTSLTSGARTLDGYDGGLWLTDEYVAAAQQVVAAPFQPLRRLGDQIDLPLDADALARLGVRYVVIDPRDRVSTTLGRTAQDDAEVATARAELVPGWTGPVLVDDSREIWENPSFESEALLYRAGGDGTVGVPAPVERHAPGVIDVATNGEGGRLVVAEQAQRGWTVTVDGQDAELVEADGFALAVDVGPGPHEVALRYRPPGLALGLAISVVSAAAALALIVLGGRRRSARRRSRRPPSPGRWFLRRGRPVDGHGIDARLGRWNRPASTASVEPVGAPRRWDS